jgi:glycosyltransferase involved in cell wall biosynthesis
VEAPGRNAFAPSRHSRYLKINRSGPIVEAPDRPDIVGANGKIRSIERRLAVLERQYRFVLGIPRVMPLGSWLRRLRPRLWDARQYYSRRVRVADNYYSENPPASPPSIAIVTPSFNQGRFIGATIDSVLSQNYPNLSYLVQDGGSNDGTETVLKSYGDRLRWLSEPDAGQGHAINRGFHEVGGDVMAYLNSDDTLLPGTLAYVARVFADNPDVDLIYGHRIYIDRFGLDIGRCVLPLHDTEALKWADYIPQETLFWRRRVWEAIGPIDESFKFALDWDFVLRAQTAGFCFRRVPRFISCFRVHEQQKGVSIFDVGEEEMNRIRAKYLGDVAGQYEVRRAILGYLLRQMFFDWMYRLRLFRY